MKWFDAHKDGLRQIHERLVERRGFGLIGAELYQNVRDTDATFCRFTIEKIPGKPRIMLKVEDDGHGFHDLSHAWTLFAPSEKKHDPTKAGRFNLGEKVVLSFAHKASIATTTGTVIFDDEGRHEFPRRKTERGTIFEAELACTSEQYDELLAHMRKIIVKPGLKLTVNDYEIPQREPFYVFDCRLATEIGDDLRSSVRNTQVQLYERVGDEIGMLYELGIPVVETGTEDVSDRWHYSVMQKVPLNSDRDNVTPAFLRSVRVAVFNEMHAKISEDDTMAPWVEEASSDPNCSDAAAATLRVKKYGEKSVAFDPSNPEANAEAASSGFTVIPSRGLTPGQRENLYRAKALQSSSQAFPTAGQGAYSDDPNADPVKVIPESQWTPGMKLVKAYTERLGELLMNVPVDVRFVYCNKFGLGKPWSACYGRGHVLGSSGRFDYNIFRLGYDWFKEGVNLKVDKLIIHEFGHQMESNHLSEDYYDALCLIGAKLKEAALDHSQWFRSHELPK